MPATQIFFTVAEVPIRLLRTRRAPSLQQSEVPWFSLSSDRLMWAKIGPVGAVVAFAILIAIVCYITQTRRK